MLTPPSVRHPTLWTMLRVGLLQGLVSYGFGTVRRLLQTKTWFENKEREILGSREAIKLERMTVLPEMQGRGVGTFSLSTALDEADRGLLGRDRRTGRPLPCVLATQDRRNLVFYGRLGFEVVDESQVVIGGKEYTNWMMIREAREVEIVEGAVEQREQEDSVSGG